MNGEFSLWRIIVPIEGTDHFRNSLTNLEDGGKTNRIQRIDPGNFSHCIDLVLTEEELAVMKLAVNDLSYCWLKDWINAKL